MTVLPTALSPVLYTHRDRDRNRYIDLRHRPETESKQNTKQNLNLSALEGRTSGGSYEISSLISNDRSASFTLVSAKSAVFLVDAPKSQKVGQQRKLPQGKGLTP